MFGLGFISGAKPREQWNSADVGVGIALSNGGLTASVLSGTVRSLTSKDAGAWYWEVEIDSCAQNTHVNVGIAKAGHNQALALGSDVGGSSIGFLTNGVNTYYRLGGNSYILNTGTFGAGDVLGLGLDFATGTIFLFINGVNRGAPSIQPGTTWFPAVGTGAITTGAWVGTANFGATPFAHTHVGYDAYDPA